MITFLIILLIYILGVNIALFAIRQINSSEAALGGSMFINEMDALFSWVLVVFMLVIFIVTYITWLLK